MDVSRGWHDALARLVADDRLAQGDEFPAVVAGAAAPLGVDVRLYAVDQQQRTLRPVLWDGAHLPVDTTAAGRAYMHVQAVPVPGPRLWMPLLDGVERLGVLEIVARDPAVDLDDPAFRAGCDLFSQLTGHLYAVKVPYGDTLKQARRTRGMSEAAELLWRLLPPLTFASKRVVIAAILEPCYEVGGDGFDYAVDGDTAFFAVFDSVGHTLRSGLGTTTVLAAVRAARAAGAGLPDLARAADEALVRHLPEMGFTTAVLGTLDLATGRLRYLNAGHPAPMILRNGAVVGRLDRGRRLPLGLTDEQAEPAEERLEPGDRLLLFTDGVTDSRAAGGELFGEDRLAGLVRQHTAAGLPAPETLRRLCHATLDHYDGPPADDATMLYLEWSPEAADRVTP
ncbi:PP2C family protein-serine/threonine phosphatase [Actinoplanes sp. RD1]|uniref:PP2C family protein-serine/threonine phosphatase n=1 Tax=Actinoplanes sp. RD1 TaxID=3064538 RepID=UPI002741031D|nr:PP2C family protein-serine/threonine phosphatase [Actinoplanes sp. RD1]